MHVLWINAGMKNSPVQRLSVQVKNIKKKSILPEWKGNKFMPVLPEITRAWIRRR